MSATSPNNSRPPNGRDFYVILGRVESGDHRWEIAERYGLLNAGGGSKYWKQLERLEVGNRVFAYVARAGYVGIGWLTGEMIPARDAEVRIDDQRQPLLDQLDLNAACKKKEESSLGRSGADRDGRSGEVAGGHAARRPRNLGEGTVR